MNWMHIRNLEDCRVVPCAVSCTESQGCAVTRTGANQTVMMAAAVEGGFMQFTYELLEKVIVDVLALTIPEQRPTKIVLCEMALTKVVQKPVQRALLVAKARTTAERYLKKEQQAATLGQWLEEEEDTEKTEEEVQCDAAARAQDLASRVKEAHSRASPVKPFSATWQDLVCKLCAQLLGRMKLNTTAPGGPRWESEMFHNDMYGGSGWTRSRSSNVAGLAAAEATVTEYLVGRHECPAKLQGAKSSSSK